MLLEKFRKDWKESGEQARRLREKDRKEREDKRRREAFSGKYSKLFYRILRKNFLYNWRDYILFILCGIIVVAFAFALLGSYQALAELHSDEGTMAATLGAGEGLRKILLNAMFPLGICAVFLMVYVLMFYLKKRLQSYSMFVTLGIRKKALHITMVVEMTVSIVISFVFGCLLGNVLTILIRQGMHLVLGEEIIFSLITGDIYLKILFVVVAFYALCFLVVVFVSDFNPITENTRSVKQEKIPKKRLKIWLTLGILLAILSVFLYSRIWNFEKVYLLGLFFASVFLILRFGGAAYLRRERQGKHYLPKLMERNQIYHRSATTTWYIAAMIVVHLCAVFYFTFPVVSTTIAEEPESLFPYNFMCIADDNDDEFFQNLQKEYGVVKISYPMVRVVSGDKTQEAETRMGNVPQGQNIGISESTYHELKKALDPEYQAEPLGLDDEGKGVVIVHQQDRSIKAQPIDYSSITKIKPFLHIGLPCKGFSLNDTGTVFSFPHRKIIKEEIGSLTGCYREGALENLVVFSDDYFRKAQEMWMDTDIYDGKSFKWKQEEYGWVEDYYVPEAIPGVNVLQGPTKLVLLKVEKENIDAIKQEMRKLEEKHYEDFELSYDPEINCWYSSREAIQDMKTERIMKLIVNAFVIVILAVTGMFLLIVKIWSEMEEKKARATFLECMGMSRKARVQLLKKELFLYYLAPFVISTGAAVLFIAATFCARMYTFSVIKEYLPRAVLVWAGYFIIQWIFIWILGKVMIRKVEGRYVRRKS